MSENSSNAPAILLVRPQLGQNIGATARAMLNYGLTDLRIIKPRDGWPNPDADPMAAGAFEAGVTVRAFDSLKDAVEDLSFLAAATARPRGMEKDVEDAEATVRIARSFGSKAGILFGSESSGLLNDEVTVADIIMTYPVNPNFASLNLAQAVMVFAAAWGAQTKEIPNEFDEREPPASRADLIGMFEHFEVELQRAGFFYPPEKTELMTRNLRNAFTRAGWSAQEVRTFRGAIKALALGRGKARIERED